MRPSTDSYPNKYGISFPDGQIAQLRGHLAYLGAFAWRFNRRFVLKTIHERLAIAATVTPPMPYRLLKLAEPRW